MNNSLETVAQRCLHGAETDTMTFPQIVETLTRAGFEGYAIDYRRGNAVFYTYNGRGIEIPAHRLLVPIAEAFDTTAVQDAIRDAQQGVPGYTYSGFCKKMMAAGCAGYIVSFSGRRVIYFGRTAETHIELFPS